MTNFIKVAYKCQMHKDKKLFLWPSNNETWNDCMIHCSYLSLLPDPMEYIHLCKMDNNLVFKHVMWHDDDQLKDTLLVVITKWSTKVNKIKDLKFLSRINMSKGHCHGRITISKHFELYSISVHYSHVFMHRTDMSQGCPQRFLPKICPNGTWECPTNGTYHVETYHPKYQNLMVLPGSRPRCLARPVDFDKTKTS